MDHNQLGRKELEAWLLETERNCYLSNEDYRHTLAFHLKDTYQALDPELQKFGQAVVSEIIPWVRENNLPKNLPTIKRYDALGRPLGVVEHHPSYIKAGDLIYKSRLMEWIAKKGGLKEGLAFFFLSSHAAEAGHNCPIACSAGILRVFQKVSDFPEKTHYLEKLIAPSFQDNFTGAQFVTEIQGGSDVGKNAVRAELDEKGNYRIYGEKWFCSNANADLILMTARYDPNIRGTKGLGLFLVPARLKDDTPNHFSLKRLKDKLGTRTLATAEIDFEGAIAIPMGPLEEGFKTLMENVLHISRLFNTVSTLGMARRAYEIAYAYAKHRTAFGQPIIAYPLVKENLATIKAENTAVIASIFKTAALQDQVDLSGEEKGNEKLLLRLLANLNKYLSALWTVEHIHHALDVLAGNGTIETFSQIPLLLRDAIICENWEGTHNTLRMQILRDIQKYRIDEIFLDYLKPNLSHPSLKSAFNTLSENLKILKNSDPELQTLQIKQVVDQMALLFSGLALFEEAQDQKAKGSSSKMDCFEYFAVSHLNFGPLKDSKPLDLLNQMFPGTES